MDEVRQFVTYKQYTISTTAEAEDYISALLSDLGIEGVQIEDDLPLAPEDREKLFADLFPELPKDTGIARMSFFLEMDQEDEGRSPSELLETAYGIGHEELLEQVKEGLKELRSYVDIGEGSIAVSESKEQDWRDKWKEYFKPFTIEDIYITPSWDTSVDREAYPHVIEIDPGTSFGTGQHETTRLCIEALRRYLKPGAKVLDMGCGSGILSIVSLALGSAGLMGIDIDPICIIASLENTQRNGFSAKEAIASQIRDSRILDPQAKFYQGNLLTDPVLKEEAKLFQADVVVANIFADVLIPLAPLIYDLLDYGGIYISSGIIDFKEDEVISVMEEAGFEILEVDHQGEWVGVTAKR